MLRPFLLKMEKRFGTRLESWTRYLRNWQKHYGLSTLAHPLPSICLYINTFLKFNFSLRKYLGFWTCNNPDGDLVMAFALPISDHIPVLLFAVLKLGATYLSIPPIYPEQLIVKIVSVTKPMIVITDSDETTRARYNCVKALVPIIDFEELYEIAEKGPFDAVNEVFPLEYISAPYARMASIVYTAGTMDQQLGKSFT